MPNANVLKQKQEQVAALAEKMKNSAAGVLVDYRGITVADDTKLRRELREAGVEYSVIKNNILRRCRRGWPGRADRAYVRYQRLRLFPRGSHRCR